MWASLRRVGEFERGKDCRWASLDVGEFESGRVLSWANNILDVGEFGRE